MTKHLYFDYPSTSRIRIHHRNVYTNSHGLFRIITKKLDFIIAEKLCICSGDHVYIPLSIYRTELEKFYKKVLV